MYPRRYRPFSYHYPGLCTNVPIPYFLLTDTFVLLFSFYSQHSHYPSLPFCLFLFLLFYSQFYKLSTLWLVTCTPKRFSGGTQLFSLQPTSKEFERLFTNKDVYFSRGYSLLNMTSEVHCLVHVIGWYKAK